MGMKLEQISSASLNSTKCMPIANPVNPCQIASLPLHMYAPVPECQRTSLERSWPDTVRLGGH